MQKTDFRVGLFNDALGETDQVPWLFQVLEMPIPKHVHERDAVGVLAEQKTLVPFTRVMNCPVCESVRKERVELAHYIEHFSDEVFVEEIFAQHEFFFADNVMLPFDDKATAPVSAINHAITARRKAYRPVVEKIEKRAGSFFGRLIGAVDNKVGTELSRNDCTVIFDGNVLIHRRKEVFDVRSKLRRTPWLVETAQVQLVEGNVCLRRVALGDAPKSITKDLNDIHLCVLTCFFYL